MLSDKLKAVRLQKGLKQSDVAAAIGCASTSFTNWENGKVNPPLEQLEKICVFYGINPLELLDPYPSLTDIKNIAKLDLSARTYEESVALTFCGSILRHVDDKTTAREEEALRLFRLLGEKQQQMALQMLLILM